VDLWDLAKLMGRRWYLMAPMIILTLAATSWALLTIKPDYTSTGQIMLIPPADRTPLTPAELQSTNTWVEVGEDIMAKALSISLNTNQTHKEIEGEGFSTTFEVAAEDRSSILTVTATATTAAAAQATVQRLQKQITREVEEMQARYKPKAGRAISTQVLDAGDTIEVVSSKVKRAAVVIIGVGLLLTAAVTIVGDNILRRRARAQALRRRQAGDLEGGDDGDVIADTDRSSGGRVNGSGKPVNGKEAVAKQDETAVISLGRIKSTVATGNGSGTANANANANAAGAGLTVAYRQAEIAPDDDRRGVEPDDATIILPLGNTPWAGREGRDKDAEARNR
jgi:capsular polysaccharide biosynthesis protein